MSVGRLFCGDFYKNPKQQNVNSLSSSPSYFLPLSSKRDRERLSKADFTRINSEELLVLLLLLLLLLVLLLLLLLLALGLRVSG